jgi:hypothetical protein
MFYGDKLAKTTTDLDRTARRNQSSIRGPHTNRGSGHVETTDASAGEQARHSVRQTYDGSRGHSVESGRPRGHPDDCETHWQRRH